MLVGRYADARLPNYSGERLDVRRAFPYHSRSAASAMDLFGRGGHRIEFEDLVNDIAHFMA